MADRALYLRIADEIAGDIRSGRLAEGQRVPSTRRIVRDRGVAMATATKVIGSLREAGLVETIPGSGTIVRRRDERTAGTGGGPGSGERTTGMGGPGSGERTAGTGGPGSRERTTGTGSSGSGERTTGTGGLVSGERPVRAGGPGFGERAVGTGGPVFGERARNALTRREIVEAAVRIADTDGLPHVTMRRVAVSLGVSTMALYRHVPNRGDLTLRMTDSVFAGARLPEIPMASWRRRLEAVAHVFWTLFGRHPWAAEVFSLSRPQLMPNVMPLAEWSLSTLRAMGFDVYDMLCAHINLFGHVRSMALVRLAEAQAEEDTGMSADNWMDLQDGLRRWASSAGGDSGLGHVVRGGFDFDLDTVFEYGLQRMLDGIDARRRALGLPG
jgi:AcrR family transcriptional regulator